VRAQLPLVVFAAVGMTASFAALTSGVSVDNVREDFTAFAINLNPGPTTARIDIRIERWSTDEEREQLLDILRGEGSRSRTNRELLRALRRMPRAGFIRSTGTLAWDLRYTQQQPLEEGGRQIVIATDRPIDFWEARNRPRVSDYPFTLLELRLDQNNRGEGKMLAQTRISIDPRTSNLVLEHYSHLPVRLNRIRPR
jgi:hypothetical protein